MDETWEKIRALPADVVADIAFERGYVRNRPNLLRRMCLRDCKLCGYERQPTSTDFGCDTCLKMLINHRGRIFALSPLYVDTPDSW